MAVWICKSWEPRRAAGCCYHNDNKKPERKSLQCCWASRTAAGGLKVDGVSRLAPHQMQMDLKPPQSGLNVDLGPNNEIDYLTLEVPLPSVASHGDGICLALARKVRT